MDNNEETVKKKRKSNGKNSPIIGMNGYDLKPGDNAKIVAVNLALFNMPEINLRDPEEVAKRLEEFFNLYISNDMKPTVAGMALALNGMARQTLSAIARDAPTGGYGCKTALPTMTADCIKKAYKMMENMWESYMNSGKLNPVTGIFLGKNNYGYQDKVEHVVSRGNQDEEYNIEEIKERYMLPDSNE